MYKFLDKDEFTQEWCRVIPRSWSTYALRALYDYLTEYEEIEIGQDLEFDPITFDQEFGEAETLDDIHPANEVLASLPNGHWLYRRQ